MDLKKVIQDKLDTIKSLRIKLHENAELSYQEFKTQKIIMDFLNELNIPAVKMAETGVVGVLNEGKSCIGIRADMDALPVNGVSHACGHDYHMAVALGTALVLKELGFEKCVKFVFQPAEEAEGGALPMINEGVLENPTVKYMIGYHVWPGLPVGKIEVGKGASMASVDDFNITFKGIGGHAAMPHICKNPIFPAMDLIQAITMKSRIETDPLNSHVITFSSFNAGTTNNVIPAEAVVKGTARTFDNKLRKKIHEDIVAQAKLSAEKYGCEAVVDYIVQYPPVISDDALTEEFIEVSNKTLGSENVLPLIKTFGAEDFAFFAERVPSVHFRLGISNGIKGNHPLHSPYFDVDDDAIFYGIYTVASFVLHLADRV
ncbi:M20 metallopeptidase family protein [Fonticella tunisiensis]|uniref:Hippurate hydrolase n=1 Tax=Fonticella tunisiensis TaxID=1096341 RepID=A0A4R7KRI0_9CLOT|nr:M20 family metallopeptidase [Fonticella tunisiensis]TDT61304.1 hippurate hydrolase [Fonticella tunisiensis]